MDLYLSMKRRNSLIRRGVRRGLIYTYQKGTNLSILQVVTDNFDATVHSKNGKQQTHYLPMMLVQPSHHDDSKSQREFIPRLKQEKLRDTKISDIRTEYYKGPKCPPMPHFPHNISVLPHNISVLPHNISVLDTTCGMHYLILRFVETKKACTF